MNDRVLDFIQSGDFRPSPTVTEQVLGNLPQAIATLHHIARVGRLYGILSVLPTREPRQRYSTRQTVQVDAVVDTRRTRDLGVAIARVLMQVNLIGESRTLDLPSRVRSLVRTPAGNPQGIEDGFDLTVGGTPTVIARILTDHLHTMLAQTLDIYLDEFAFNLVGHAIGKLLGIEVVYLRVIRSTGGVHGIGLFDRIGFGFEFQIVIHREREAALFQFDRPTRKLGVILTVHSRTENGEVITPVYSANGTTAFINGNNLQDGKIVIKPDTKRVTDEEASKHKRCLTKDTVLLSINGTIGNVAFYDGEHVILGKSACYFNLLSGVSKEYVRLVLETDYFARYAVSVATGTTIKNVPLAGMRNLLRRPVQWVCGAV